MSHHPLCYFGSADGTGLVWVGLASRSSCTCSDIEHIRAAEREQVADDLMRAPENVVKISGISIAVIQRGTAIAVARGEYRSPDGAE